MTAALAFLRRGLITTLSYRLNLSLAIIGTLVGLLQYMFLARFVSQGNSFPAIERYGGDLISYFLVGTAYMAFVAASLESFHNTVRSEQQMGTLEFLFISEHPIWLTLFYSGLWNFLRALLDVAVFFAILVLAFRVPLHANLLAAAVVLALTVAAVSGIGFCSAGIVLVTKRGDPFGWLFSAVSSLVSGVLFPTEILPYPLQALAQCLPTTHALRALRLALMVRAPLPALVPELRVLALMAAVTVPAGLVVLRWGFNVSRRCGTLGEY
ncbi:MAG: ABC transporter permease [Acetobacteraceae bacterium]|nr:ABC transporter permease [Acetobacteraceae bacterium]